MTPINSLENMFLSSTLVRETYVLPLQPPNLGQATRWAAFPDASHWMVTLGTVSSEATSGESKGFSWWNSNGAKMAVGGER